MRNISNSDRSFGYDETSGEDGNSTASFENSNKNLINKANSISILKIFKWYSIRLDENTRKATCPFLSHKGGRERTPSFCYYPSTNTFYCHGCNTGSKPCDLVAIMDRCSKLQAARKILELCDGDDSNYDFIIEKEDFSERLEIMLNFSTMIREFILNHSDEQSLLFIDKICQIYDSLNIKHNLNNEALKKMCFQLEQEIIGYK